MHVYFDFAWFWVAVFARAGIRVVGRLQIRTQRPLENSVRMIKILAAMTRMVDILKVLIHVYPIMFNVEKQKAFSGPAISGRKN